MTEQEKQILLVDLCARLPYGVKAKVNGHINPLQILGISRLHKGSWAWKKGSYVVSFWNDTKAIEIIKPYLRLMSAMTENEIKEYHKVIIESQNCSFENSESATTMVNDWLLSKHFDVRGLISKNLALTAPKGIYK